MIKFSGEPMVMGVLNVTPDSFSDGGKFNSLDLALRHAERMVRDGADIIDVGGESTRPGADHISVQEELDRICPVLERLSDSFDVLISVDSRRTEVMQVVLSSFSVDMINDVNALKYEGAIELLSLYPNVSVCLMHCRGGPQDMQSFTDYSNGVVVEVINSLRSSVLSCLNGGISEDRLILDVGIGFSKTADQNVELLRAHSHIRESLGKPMLLGVSRKSFLGKICGEDIPLERLGASVAAALLSFDSVDIIRVHDVKETVQALSVWKVLG